MYMDIIIIDEMQIAVRLGDLIMMRVPTFKLLVSSQIQPWKINEFADAYYIIIIIIKMISIFVK